MNTSPRQKFTLTLAVLGAATIVGCSHFSKKGERNASRRPQSQYSGAFTSLQNSIHSFFKEPQAAPDPISIQLAKSWVVARGPDGEFITSLQEIDERKLQTGAPEIQPWSGDYWPDRIGGVAVRYSKGSRALGMAYGASHANRQTLRRNDRIADRFDDLSTEKIALLSPAEKYDILLGDEDFNFTHQVMNGIKTSQDTFSGMPMWNGICNGWSPASFLLERPRHAIAVQSPHGKTVTFYPDDIKALASHLFARSFVSDQTYFFDSAKPQSEQSPDQSMYGLRCNVGKPKLDANGSVLPLRNFKRSANECSDDVNPAVWHLAIVNRMGVQKNSFVVDKDYNSPVNNHPLAGYNYEYFNPITKKVGNSFESAVKISDFTDDPYRARRSKDAAFIVGVEMTLKYIGNIKARIKATDDESQDKVKDWKVTYDLELDRDQRIIGGEWRLTDGKPAYPDFMWYQRPWVWANGEPPMGSEWNGFQVPNDWRERSISGEQAYPFDQPTQYNKDSGYLTYNRGQGVMERADHPLLTDAKIRAEAFQVGRKYINLCYEYCADAYLNGKVEAKNKLEPLEVQITALHRQMDTAGVPKATGATFTRMSYGTLSQRAYDPALKDETLRKKAIAASYAYDSTCAKYCAAAYQGQARNEQEKTYALAQMKIVNDDLTRYQDYLDTYGVPMSAPYAQPLGKVIYKLVEMASDPNLRQNVYLPRGESSNDETPSGYGEDPDTN